jgi:hypothetical protein
MLAITADKVKDYSWGQQFTFRTPLFLVYASRNWGEDTFRVSTHQLLEDGMTADDVEALVSVLQEIG